MMKRSAKRLLSLAMLLVLVLGLAAGCSGDQGNSSTPPSSDPVVSPTGGDEPQGGDNAVVTTSWDFSMISVLTGSVASAGIPAHWGAQYAVDQINASGGIRGVPVTLSVRDSAFDTAKAVQEMSGIVDKSLVVFGPMDGPGTDAAGQVAFESKVPFLAAATTEVVREKYAPYAISYMTDSEKGAANAAVKWVETNPDIKSVVIFYYPSDNASTSEYNLAKEYLEAAGVEVIGSVEVTTGQLDLGPSVVKAMGYNPDGYFVCLRVEEFARAVIELRNRGVDEGRRMMGTFSSIAANLFDLGGEALEDVYLWNKIDPNYDSPEWEAFVEAYKADNGGQAPSNNTAANYYEAMMSVAEAIEALELTGDPAKLQEERDALANYLFNSPVYNFIQGDFQQVDGERVSEPHFLQIKDGAFTSVS